MGFNCLKARATSRRQFTFYHLVPRNLWYSGGALFVGEWKAMGWCKKSYFKTRVLAEAISMTHTGMLYQLYIFPFLFLWVIAVSDFCPLEIYKTLGFPLPAITFTVTQITISIIIFVCFKYSFFLSKQTLRFFIFKFDLKECSNETLSIS